MAAYIVTVKRPDGTAVKIEVTGAQDNVRRLASALQTACSETAMQQHARVLTCIRGGKESQHETWVLGGSDAGGKWPDLDGYREEAAAFAASLPAKIKSTELATWLAKADDIKRRHMPVDDQRETPDEHAAQVAEMQRHTAAQEAANQERERAEAESNARLHTEHPYLIPADNSGKLYGCTLAAENIRRELARAFPGVTFSAKSERFSGGDSVHVNWTDGPTTAQVDAIIKRYQPYASDYTGDYWDYQPDLATWSKAFGDARFVSGERNISPATEGMLMAWAQANPISNAGDDWHCQPQQRVYRLFSATSLPAGAVVTGVERRTDENDETGEAGDWRVLYTAPTPAPSTETAQPAPTTTTAQGYTVEQERDWTWIKFDAKPAAEMLDKVRSLGAKFSGRRAAWYITRPVDAAQIAGALA